VTTTIIQMQQISKCFGNSYANDSVDLEVFKGEILALLGENGAGKSTLMKILFGLYSRDRGNIEIDGTRMPMVYSPSDAMHLGIAMVHQHFKLVESLPVAENIVLGAEDKILKVTYDRKKVRAELDKLYEFTGITLPSDTLIRDLPLGERQRVEILKALFRGCKVLILDEPTTVLTPQETENLFELLRHLRKQGMTILIITHKLAEVLALSDRVVVMRRGKLVKTLKTAETNAAELANTMVGYELKSAKVIPKSCLGLPIAMCLDDLHTVQDQGCSLKGLNLSLFSGRVVGIAGVDGNGQSELVEVLAGIRKPTSGSITIKGENIGKRNDALRQKSIRIIPEDRHCQGLVLPLTLQDNLLLGFRNRKELRIGPVFRIKEVRNFLERIITDFDIRPGVRTQKVQLMSGGNQQKVVLARELSQQEMQITVASQPTRGLDVGAIQFTHSQIIGLRDEGKAVLLISSDLDEIRALSDEIAVIHNGRIVVQKAADQLDRLQLGLYMGGGTAEEEKE